MAKWSGDFFYGLLEDEVVLEPGLIVEGAVSVISLWGVCIAVCNGVHV